MVIYIFRFCYRTLYVTVSIDNQYFINLSILLDGIHASHSLMVISAAVSAVHARQDSVTT